MFAFLPAADPGMDFIDKLVIGMLRPGLGHNPSIPAGYTYLAQFIDHDITFDPTSQLQRRNDPNALVNFRTPRLDLDSLYGSGPLDQPFLYEWKNEARRGVALVGGEDLERNSQGRALIGDARNDENLIVSQLHLLFIHFHNRVVEHVHRRAPALCGADLLREAQRVVRWHYQWIVVHDFLRKIVGSELANSMLAQRFYRWGRAPFIPVEFSAAAYRFGHSMVRGSYRINDPDPDVDVAILKLDDDPGSTKHLGGFRALPRALKIDWSFFFQLPRREPPQLSRALDTNIAAPLHKLPTGLSSEHAPLPRLNLQRARALGLPSGTDVARALGVPSLSSEQLRLDLVPAKYRPALLKAPPLWFYILCEAASDLGEEGRHLGPVGGRIVAEVLIGLLTGDPNSYVREWPPWTPELRGATAGDFTMSDLVVFTQRKE